MALTKDERQKIDETHDAVLVLKTLLLGKNSDKGLVGQVWHNTKRINNLYLILASVGGAGGVAGVVTKMLEVW